MTTFGHLSFNTLNPFKGTRYQHHNTTYTAILKVTDFVEGKQYYKGTLQAVKINLHKYDLRVETRTQKKQQTLTK